MRTQSEWFKRSSVKAIGFVATGMAAIFGVTLLASTGCLDDGERGGPEVEEPDDALARLPNCPALGRSTGMNAQFAPVRVDDDYAPRRLEVAPRMVSLRDSDLTVAQTWGFGVSWSGPDLDEPILVGEYQAPTKEGPCLVISTAWKHREMAVSFGANAPPRETEWEIVDLTVTRWEHSDDAAPAVLIKGMEHPELIGDLSNAATSGNQTLLEQPRAIYHHAAGEGCRECGNERAGVVSALQNLEAITVALGFGALIAIVGCAGLGCIATFGIGCAAAIAVCLIGIGALVYSGTQLGQAIQAVEDAINALKCCLHVIQRNTVGGVTNNCGDETNQAHVIDSEGNDQPVMFPDANGVEWPCCYFYPQNADAADDGSLCTGTVCSGAVPGADAGGRCGAPGPDGQILQCPMGPCPPKQWDTYPAGACERDAAQQITGEMEGEEVDGVAAGFAISWDVRCLVAPVLPPP